MKRFLVSFLFTLYASLFISLFAQNDLLTAKQNVIPGGYNFWVYTPHNYEQLGEETPVVIFLHGASLCGHNLASVRRYGPLQAIQMGLEIPALIIAPQNPGGAWSPRKLNDLLEWTKANYACDSTRVYVLGMSLGGYGTMDFCGTYPEKIAAGIALCGGTTLKDKQGLGNLPFWIMHGTADRAININQSKVVVNALVAEKNDQRLRYDWIAGASHGALARVFYLGKTYDWLFSHRLADEGRPVNRSINISQGDMWQAYRTMKKRTTPLKVK